MIFKIIWVLAIVLSAFSGLSFVAGSGLDLSNQPNHDDNANLVKEIPFVEAYVFVIKSVQVVQ